MRLRGAFSSRSSYLETRSHFNPLRMSRSPNSSVRRLVLLGGLVVAVVAASAATTVRTDGRTFFHTRLIKSIPAKDSVLSASPATVQLWFSEKIELGLSRVRLEGADGKSVSATPLTQAASVADAPVVARVPARLADGTYTLHWTAASGDGHAVKGSFGFTIMSH